MWLHMSKEEKLDYKKLSDKDRMRFDEEKSIFRRKKIKNLAEESKKELKIDCPKITIKQ